MSINKNEVVDAILQRRSVRSYQDKQIEDEQLEVLLTCAKYAPTGLNNQPWNFTVVQNKELLEKMARECFEVNRKNNIPWYQGEYCDVFYHAPTVIFIHRDMNKQLSYFDCCLAAENIVIAAKSLGLGSCILIDALAMFNGDRKEEFFEDLKVPQGYIPHIAIAIGFQDKQARKKEIKIKEVVVIK